MPRRKTQPLENVPSLPKVSRSMNQSLLLHVVERLETFFGKLPAGIQKPILHELTPMKELFLQQRPPRLLFAGSNKTPVLELLRMLFPEAVSDSVSAIATVNRWHDFQLTDRGTISILDARSSDENSGEVEDELKRQAADLIFFIDGKDSARKTSHKSAIKNLTLALHANERANTAAKVIALLEPSGKAGTAAEKSESSMAEWRNELETALKSISKMDERLVGVFYLGGPNTERQANKMMSLIARELPNSARIEMARISKDRVVQEDIAQILVKSTTAICTAIGAQPIPLADLPILTTLQLVMVSGIMYVSGRERSLRAATEFVGALGANVGAGMLLREGTRAVLKFFPGWGNIICGMVAGAGTYAIGRAATVFFVGGVTLKDARRTYLSSRKKSARPQLLDEPPTRKSRKKNSK
jgi:uncharacterized protein (DUF697 family)